MKAGLPAVNLTFGILELMREGNNDSLILNVVLTYPTYHGRFNRSDKITYFLNSTLGGSFMKKVQSQNAMTTAKAEMKKIDANMKRKQGLTTHTETRAGCKVEDVRGTEAWGWTHTGPIYRCPQ